MLRPLPALNPPRPPPAAFARHLPARAAFYRPQIAAYVRALRAATSQPVTGMLLFLHPSAPAVAMEVID